MSANKGNKKQLMNRRTKFTMFSMFNIVWYTVAVLVLSYYDHIVPSELTVAWFSSWTVELALLFGIKIRGKHDTAADTASTVIQTASNVISNNVTIEPQKEEEVQDYSEDVG